MSDIIKDAATVERAMWKAGADWDGEEKRGKTVSETLRYCAGQQYLYAAEDRALFVDAAAILDARCLPAL